MGAGCGVDVATAAVVADGAVVAVGEAGVATVVAAGVPWALVVGTGGGAGPGVGWPGKAGRADRAAVGEWGRRVARGLGQEVLLSGRRRSEARDDPVSRQRSLRRK